MAIVQSLGEIKGMLSAFVQRFDRHEAQDATMFDKMDKRFDRFEQRAEERTSDMRSELTGRQDKILTTLDIKFSEMSAKVEANSSARNMLAGGWKALSVIGAVIASLGFSIFQFFQHRG